MITLTSDRYIKFLSHNHINIQVNASVNLIRYFIVL